MSSASCVLGNKEKTKLEDSCPIGAYISVGNIRKKVRKRYNSRGKEVKGMTGVFGDQIGATVPRLELQVGEGTCLVLRQLSGLWLLPRVRWEPVWSLEQSSDMICLITNTATLTSLLKNKP